jgi:hypothetical protein
MDIRVIIGGISFFAIPLVVGWLLVTGLVRGRIRAHGSFSRADEPISFWTTAALYAGLILFWIAIVCWAITIGLEGR